MTRLKEKSQKSRTTPTAPANFTLRCTNDYVFKMLFTLIPERGEILLKDMLNRTFDLHVEHLEFLPTELNPPFIQGKQIRLDLSVIVNQKIIVNIEMQANSLGNSAKYRNIFYSAMGITSQQLKGRRYTDLNKLIQIVFNRESSYQQEKGLTRVGLIDFDSFDLYSDLLKIIILEMPKHIEGITGIEHMRSNQQWPYFLMNYNRNNQDRLVKILMERYDVFKEADEIMKRLSEDQNLKDAAFAREKMIMDMNQLRHDGFLEGAAKGEAVGLAKGETVGLAKGETIGLVKGEALGLEKAKNIFKLSLEGKTAEEIHHITGYSIELIDKILSD